jgi:tRNA nucleotidyltransferase (CCA-adding enzyme)
MDTYLVGGAVRDKLLGLPVTERDWVVVGATVEQLTGQGYQSVGKDFPVFLHPRTKEEYALARTERKSGRGHKGFICDANETVTLEEDLARRDLTINAIAEDPAGQLIDPYGGREDLQDKILRHVSAAFEEDPLRILRVARFLARFEHLGFHVAETTMALMQSMVDRGDLDELTPERVFMECEKALKATTPTAFFRLLQTLGADKKLWPVITKLDRLDQLSQHTDKPEYRFAALFVEIPMAATRQLAKALKAPNRYTELAVMTSQAYLTWLALPTLDSSAILALFQQLDGFRRQERFQQFMDLSGLLARADITNAPARQAAWQQLYGTCASASAADVAPDLQGPAISQAIKAVQLARIEAALDATPRS